MEFPFGLSDEENPSVKQLKVALETAIYEADVEIKIPEEYTGVRGFYNHNIKVNKIAYLPIIELDLPIVRTWYKYGQYEPYPELTPKALDPKPLKEQKEYAFSSQKRAFTVDDIVEFLLDLDIESMFQQELFEFLTENYKELAPPNYRDIYLASTKILDVLEDLWWSNRDSLLENIPEYRSKFKQASIDMRYEVDHTTEFDSGLQNHVERSLLSFEDALLAIEDSKNPNTNQVNAVRNIRRLYHQYVLPWIGMHISLNEIEGPEDEVIDFINDGENWKKDMQSDFPMQIRGYERTLEEVELSAFTAASQAIIGPVPQALQDLEKAALNIGDE